MQNTLLKAMKMKWLIVLGVIMLLSFFLWGIISRYVQNNNSYVNYYDSKVLVDVSPHWLRIAMSEWESKYIIVDLRSEDEYNTDHIITAVSIPAYKNRYESAYDDKERIVKAFHELQQQYPDKKIVTYCYSGACMTSTKVWQMLAHEGINVQHLNIGWNERKYHWTLWNHEHERELSKAEDRIQTWSIPWVVPVSETTACPINNEFWC